MGTRALITINEKSFIATHWDGDPPCLGKKLWYTKTETEIRAVANEHTIDFACPRVIKTEQKRRYARIASKTNGKFTAKDIEKLDKQGKMVNLGVFSAGDFAIGDIKNYGDFPRFQYDFNSKTKRWRYRGLEGCWPESGQNAGKFKRLTKKVVGL